MKTLENRSLTILDVEQENDSRFWRQLMVIYVSTYSLGLFFPVQYFWDDWMFYFDKTAEQIRGSSGAFSGFSPVRLLLEGYLVQVNPWTLHLLSFILFPVAAWSLKQVLNTIKNLAPWEKRAIVALFLLLPVNSARHSLTIFMYTFCNACFFAGWWFYAKGRNRISKVVALTLFLMSFDTASFIVFSIVPIALGVTGSLGSKNSISKFFFRNLPFLVAPLAYWFIEPLFNPNLDPVRDEYYTPKTSGILRSLTIGLIMVAATIYGFVKRKWSYESSRGQIQIAVGLGLLWLGVFPYMALGHFANLHSLLIGLVPGESDWDSRHQLLAPLGLSLLFVGVINYFQVTKRGQLMKFAIVICAVMSFTFTHEYYLDSIKTQGVIAAFSELELPRSTDSVFIDDQATRFNARGRRIRPYEWDGMMKMATKSASIETDVIGFIDCVTTDPDFVLTIGSTHGRLRTLVTRDAGITIKSHPVIACSKTESE